MWENCVRRVFELLYQSDRRETKCPLGLKGEFSFIPANIVSHQEQVLGTRLLKYKLKHIKPNIY